MLRILPVFFLILLAPFLVLAAEHPLPASITQQAGTAFKPVGSGRYTKLGFTIYRATLWTQSGQWNPEQPYALQLRYARSLSKSTVVDAVVDGIAEQKVADEPTFRRWSSQLRAVLPAVEEDDELVGLALPGQDSVLTFNGKVIARIQEPDFTAAFFGIWFGNYADKDLRAELLGQPSEPIVMPSRRDKRRF